MRRRSTRQCAGRITLRGDPEERAVDAETEPDLVEFEAIEKDEVGTALACAGAGDWRLYDQRSIQQYVGNSDVSGTDVVQGVNRSRQARPLSPGRGAVAWSGRRQITG
jgi:hypothetical protein